MAILFFNDTNRRAGTLGFKEKGYINE